MALINRGLLAFLATAPVIALGEPSAAAANPPLAAAFAPVLPHGVHLAQNGRYYQDVCDHDAAYFCLAKRLLPPTYRPESGIPPHPGGGGTTTSPPAGTMAPKDVLAAYSLTSASSAGGKIVAIQDMPYTTALADLNVYRKEYGIPALPQCAGKPSGTTPCFAVVDQTGKLNPTGLADGGTADTETSLDMDMISAACADCSILLVEFTSAQGPSDQDFIAAAKTAAGLGAQASSISWGGNEGSNDPTGYTIPGKMLVLAASGDSGYLQEGGAVLPYKPAAGGGPGGGGGNSNTAGYPASAPDVLGVGGTTLQSSGGSYSEIVWNDQSGATSSGCSQEYAMPSYQTAFLASHASAFGDCAMRATNDIAAAADFTASGGGGIAEYSSTQGGWGAVVGTSAATPEVAAILVRLGLALKVSSDFGYIYDNIADFNDVTSGTDDNNGICASTSTVMCTAGPGWDGPTGVGTPNGTKLLSGGTTPTPDAGGGTTNDDAGGATTNKDGGGSQPTGPEGDDSGTTFPNNTGDSGGGITSPSGDDGGLTSVAGDDGGNSFSAPSGSAGCGCKTAGVASAPGSDTGLFALAFGVVGAVVSRRRSRKK